MIKYVWALVFSVSILFSATAQSELSDYSFVVVPDKYDFQFEDDQYQLNSLTKFLFNKYGFHAFYNAELPDVSRCSGLWADVEKDSGFIWTKLAIVLKDCDGNEVYRSSEGRSKLKEYGKAYQQSLRRAFDGIIALGVLQKDLQTFDLTKEPDVKNTTVKTPVETEPEVVSIPQETIPVSAIADEDRMYLNNGAFFILKTEENRQRLFEKKGETLILKGDLTSLEDLKMLFTDTAGNEFKAAFDSDKNLVIDTAFQQLVFQLQR